MRPGAALFESQQQGAPLVSEISATCLPSDAGVLRRQHAGDLRRRKSMPRAVQLALDLQRYANLVERETGTPHVACSTSAGSVSA